MWLFLFSMGFNYNYINSKSQYGDRSIILGCTDSASIVVVLDPCLGIYEDDLFKLSLYPNPTQNEHLM